MFEDLPNVSSLLDEGKTPEEILDIIFEGQSVMILEDSPVQFNCECSKEKFATAIITLGTSEIQAMIDEDHGAEAVCSFCGEKYHFDESELTDLIHEITGEK